MRPVNLIPPEDRRGDKAPLRTGPLAYVIVAVLVVALIGVTLVVTTGNKIADSKAEKASLESEVAETQAQAENLSTFAEFAGIQQVRQETVASLATSRFDWQRVLRELALVLPGDVWLTSLEAKASGDAAAASTSSDSSGSTANIEGPSLDIMGCAAGHDAVARFIAALRDVDGVTRVSVVSSDRPIPSGSSGGTSGGGSAGGGAGVACAKRDFISAFEVVAAFDGAEPGTSSTAAAATPAGDASAASDQGQIADAQDQLQQQRDSASRKTAQGRKAVDTFIPGTGSAP